MIPSDIVTFLEEEATVAMAATRDGDCVPHLHRISGWTVDPDGVHVICLVPDAFSQGEIESKWGTISKGMDCRPGEN